MRKAMAVMTALIIGVSYCPPGTVAMAAGNEVASKDYVRLPGNGEVEFSKSTAVLPGVEEVKEEKKNLDTEKKDEPSEDAEEIQEESVEAIESEIAENEEAEIKNLQIPQKMSVVVDPWEMDGQGQIYSEQYMVKNTGDAAGTLTLSGSVCKPQEQNDVIVRLNKEGLHDDEAKSIYMEMEFGNGDRIVLSQEGSDYQVKLNPGEELSVHFTGEVNEYSSEDWKDEDVTLDIVYSWDIEEPSAEVLDLPEDNSDAAGDEQSSEIPIEEVNDEEINDEEEIKVIDVEMLQNLEIIVDSWKTHENNQIESVQYTIRNTSEMAGTLVLSDLVCKPGEQSGIIVQTEKERLHDGTDKAVYMELIAGNGERIVLPQESQEDIRYETKLNPGEEVSVCFAGEITGIQSENLVNGDITVNAVCFWILDETASE